MHSFLSFPESKDFFNCWYSPKVVVLRAPKSEVSIVQPGFCETTITTMQLRTPFSIIFFCVFFLTDHIDKYKFCVWFQYVYIRMHFLILPFHQVTIGLNAQQQNVPSDKISVESHLDTLFLNYF